MFSPLFYTVLVVYKIKFSCDLDMKIQGNDESESLSQLTMTSSDHENEESSLRYSSMSSIAASLGSFAALLTTDLAIIKTRLTLVDRVSKLIKRG